ncbi:hypothetical protein Mal4_19420 [Maioricimonas rarisocia]|uniref:Uncharacterized protein n=1 Tax=Maioricimonas rarisocia TaxID=2528026 RepID=A0A517Z596_9PLAN|nr:hypothetical protein [Maioricimonas rarisocia]QDU37627.1 hypothetical protein Mal4_19420 [Maioricimonas rarisocia]
MAYASDHVMHISFRREEFRMAFEKPFRVVFLASLLVVEPICIVSCGIVSPIVILAWLPLLTGMLAAIAVMVLSALFRFEVGPNGIECYDFWCQPQSTGWSEIRSVSTVSLLGLTYLCLHRDDNLRSIWVPAFVDREAQFDELLQMHAGYDHSVSRELRKLRGSDSAA